MVGTPEHPWHFPVWQLGMEVPGLGGMWRDPLGWNGEQDPSALPRAVSPWLGELCERLGCWGVSGQDPSAGVQLLPSLASLCP